MFASSLPGAFWSSSAGDDAIEILEDLHRLQPYAADVTLALANALLWTGTPELERRALPLLSSYLEQFPGDARARISYADALMRRGRPVAAAEDYLRAQELSQNPQDHREATLGRIRALSTAEHYREALRVSEEALRGYPSDLHVHFARAQTLDAAGQGARARTLYRDLIHAVPVPGEALMTATRKALADLELRIGPTLDPEFRLHLNSQNLAELSIGTQVQWRFADVRSTVGAHYRFLMMRQDELLRPGWSSAPLEADADAEVVVVSAGYRTAHDLGLHFAHRFPRFFSFRLEGGLALTDQWDRALPQLAGEITGVLPAGITLNYRAWWRPLYFDIRTLPTLDLEGQGVHHRVGFSFRARDGYGRADVSYQIGTFALEGENRNQYQEVKASGEFGLIKPLGIWLGANVSLTDFRERSLSYWDPEAYVTAALRLAWRGEPLPRLRLDVTADIGFYGDRRAGSTTVQTDSGSEVVVQHGGGRGLLLRFVPTVAYRFSPGLQVSGGYAFAQSGSGVIGTPDAGALLEHTAFLRFGAMW